MQARALTIEHKHRQRPGFLASMADFSCREGEAVRAEIVLTDPALSLYCLDQQTKRAIFVDLPPDIDLTAAPFIYQTQYEQAQRLVAVPYDRFLQLAHELPPLERLIVLYISGRSGSTLVSHLFNAMDGVVSLSEPDVATQFVHLRQAYADDDATLRALLDATLRFLFKPGVTGAPSTCVVKLRSEGLRVMDLYQAVAPQATNLFLYRDAKGFVASFYRIFKRFQAPEQGLLSAYLQQTGGMLQLDLTYQTAYLEQGTEVLSLAQYLVLWWLAVLEQYVAQYTRGMPVLAIRYADLQAKREGVLTEIARYCGLPAPDLPRLLAVFARDAQAGSALAREKPDQGNQLQLRAEQAEEIDRILARHPLIQSAEFAVPGTLRL